MIRLSIRRPVAVAMAYTCVALLGVSAWRNIPLEYLPETSFPQLTLTATWPGTSPETMEAFVTSPIEAVVQRMADIERITSTTREGSAQIVVEFGREADMDFVRLDLTERMVALEEELPDGVGPIATTPYVPRAIQEQANQALLTYTFTGSLMVEALRLHLDERVVPELLQIPGVSAVEVTGGRSRLIEIELDVDRVAALGLTPTQVQQAVAALHVVRDVGGVRLGDRQWTVTIRNRPGSMKDIRDAILPVPSVTPVRLHHVADLRDTFDEQTSYHRINRGPAVSVRIYKERAANAVRLAAAARARVAELASLNPPGARFILAQNQADEIRRQLTDLRTRALIAAGVIFLVLLGFLRSLRSAAAIFTTIAFSVLIALNLVYFGGLTLNIMTLMGLALGFGLIVDNAIVVLENVYRIWQQGAEPGIAAEIGAREVVLPVFAATATTLIVFVPFVYLQGELRVLYLPLAIVVALTLVASLFVAFSFIPALSARLLRGDKRRRPPGSATVERPPVYVRFYSGLLGYTLRFPRMTVLVALLCFGGTWLLFDTNVARGVIFGGGAGSLRAFVLVNIRMPRGSDLERMDELVRYFEQRLALMPEVERYEATVTSELGSIRVAFPEHLEVTAVPLMVEDRLRSFGLGFTGADVRVYGQGPAFYGSAGGAAPNVRIRLHGYNYERLADIAYDLGRRLSQHSRVQEMNTNASTSSSDRQTEFAALIDRRAADRHGISVSEASALVRALVRGGTAASSIVLDGEPVRYDVKLAGYRLADVDALRETVVTTSRGARVPLGALIAVEERDVLATIRRENQQYERTVGYQFRGPVRLSETVRDAAVAATVLPPGYSIQDSSPYQISTEETRQIVLVLLVALGLVFMVTAALFESIRQPLVVLMSVPMALIGVFLIFFFVRATFTREAYIALIMMGGIVVNNAILLVDRVNRVRNETDLPLDDAIARGTLERVRPILMTTATTVLGLLPLVLFMPMADARIWNAFTYAVIGGLLSSALFVLTTTPALYLLFMRRS